MPTAQKKGAEPNDNIYMLIGQLLEAAKATSEGIRSLTGEVRQNAVAIISAARTLEVLEETVMQLNRIVRTGETTASESLVHMMAARSAEARKLESTVAAAQAEVDALGRRLDSMDRVQDRAWVWGKAVWYLAIAIFQLIMLAATYFAGTPVSRN